MVRDVPDVQFGPWTSPQIEIDEHGRLIGAQPGTPNNWGRWGPLDQRGTVNLMTPDLIHRASRLVRRGVRFPLGMPIGPTSPAGRGAPLHLFRYAGSDAVSNDPGMVPGKSVSDDYIVMALQGTSQLDALSHFGADQCLYNGYWVGSVTAASGARRLGIHHWREGAVGRGVLLDIATHLGVEHIQDRAEIGPDELDAVARAQRVEVEPGDLLFVRTGFLGSCFRSGKVDMINAGGLSGMTVPWLAQHDVALLGADNPAVETVTSTASTQLSLHCGALRDLGMPLAELLDLDALAEDCAADGVYEFFVVISPIPLVNAAGSPINPIAIK